MHSPSGDEVAGCFGPGWMSELEAGGEQARGDDSAGLEDQLGFGAHEEGADLDHP